MTYKRHPMNKRINAPRPRRRRRTVSLAASLAAAMRGASRALAAAGTAAEAVARSLRRFNPTRPECTLASGKADR